MTEVANESYELIRAMLAIIRSDDSADPLSLFTRYAKQVAERSSFQIDITNHGQSNQLSHHQIRQLFFIFREALNNIEKYANPDRVSGEFLWEEHALRFRISDNGRGFDLNTIQTTGHYGLGFMLERVKLIKGSFSVRSTVGKGTTITVVVPYEYEPLPQS